MNLMIDRNPGAPPLYAQLESILKQKIEQGTYKRGDFLPTEKELMAEYQPSRVTVRQAVTNLVQSGYVRARRGIGTDIVYEKVEEHLERVISFTEEMKKTQYHNGNNILRNGAGASDGACCADPENPDNGAVLLSETCAQCRRQADGLLHFLSEKNL